MLVLMEKYGQDWPHILQMMHNFEHLADFIPSGDHNKLRVHFHSLRGEKGVKAKLRRLNEAKMPIPRRKLSKAELRKKEEAWAKKQQKLRSEYEHALEIIAKIEKKEVVLSSKEPLDRDGQASQRLREDGQRDQVLSQLDHIAGLFEKAFESNTRLLEKIVNSLCKDCEETPRKRCCIEVADDDMEEEETVANPRRSNEEEESETVQKGAKGSRRRGRR